MKKRTNSEVQEELSRYLEIMKKLDKDSKNDQKYAEFITQLNSLSEFSADMYALDENRNEKPMTKEDITHILSLYSAAKQYCDSLIASKAETKGDNIRKNIAEYINRLLEKDIVAFSSTVPGKTISEIIESSRTQVIDLGKSELTSQSGQMSSRIPIEIKDDDGNTRKGFFTQATSVNIKDSFDKAMDELIQKYPERAQIYTAIKNSPKREELLSYNNIDLLYAGEYAKVYLLNIVKELEIPTNTARELLSNEQLYLDSIQDALDVLEPIGLQSLVYKSNDWLGVSEGSNIDKRNSAMTNVANLIGLPNLISHSENMKIIVDGKEISGTFMENASGKEAYRLPANDPMRNYGPEVYDNPEIIKQLADLQVLDYLCGNIDRHEGNLFFQFDTSDPEHPKATTITGIDNDLSFMAKTGENKTRNGNIFIKPSSMRIINEETAIKILSLDESVLRVNLANFSLSEAEQSAAIERLNILKTAISEGLEFYNGKELTYLDDSHIKIVKNEELHNFSLETLSTTRMPNINNVIVESPIKNQFSVIRDMKKLITIHDKSVEKKEQSHRQYLESRNIPVPQNAQANRPAIATGSASIDFNKAGYFIKNKLSSLENLLTDCETADPFWLVSSQNYKDMKSALTELINETKKIDNNFHYDNFVTIRNLMKDLNQKVEKYKEGKITEGKLSSRAKERIAVANSINDTLNDMSAIITKTESKYINSVAVGMLLVEGYDYATIMNMQPFENEIIERAKEIFYSEPGSSKKEEFLQNIDENIGKANSRNSLYEQVKVLKGENQNIDELKNFIIENNKNILNYSKYNLKKTNTNIMEINMILTDDMFIHRSESLTNGNAVVLNAAFESAKESMTDNEISMAYYNGGLTGAPLSRRTSMFNNALFYHIMTHPDFDISEGLKPDTLKDVVKNYVQFMKDNAIYKNQNTVAPLERIEEPQYSKALKAQAEYYKKMYEYVLFDMKLSDIPTAENSAVTYSKLSILSALEIDNSQNEEGIRKEEKYYEAFGGKEFYDKLTACISPIQSILYMQDKLFNENVSLPEKIAAKFYLKKLQEETSSLKDKTGIDLDPTVYNHEKALLYSSMAIKGLDSDFSIDELIDYYNGNANPELNAKIESRLIAPYETAKEYVKENPDTERIKESIQFAKQYKESLNSENKQKAEKVNEGSAQAKDDSAIHSRTKTNFSMLLDEEDSAQPLTRERSKSVDYTLKSDSKSAEDVKTSKDFGK